MLESQQSMKKAVSLINTIDIGRFPRLLTRILQKLHLKNENSFSGEEEEKLQAAFSLERQDLHLVLETISFILEQAVYHNMKPAALQQQLENIHLSPDKAEAFVNAWSSMGPEVVEKFRQRSLAPHKLETVGWQLNLQMANLYSVKTKISPKAVLSRKRAMKTQRVWRKFLWNSVTRSCLISITSSRLYKLSWIPSHEDCFLHVSTASLSSIEDRLPGCIFRIIWWLSSCKLNEYCFLDKK
ncbi:COMM domain-containing protein 10 [Suncus etruscus]|uniref:COMM domain-containing protein 10 n=1 Tax=Suncus etruscus TaxID=109475 RepID=UPI002110D6D5|nr:COMM domain-containing protein 10 [Suncus etruscus]